MVKMTFGDYGVDAKSSSYYHDDRELSFKKSLY